MLKDRQFAGKLQNSLKELEKQANDPSFIDFLKQNKETDVFALRKKYDFLQLEKVIEGLEFILKIIEETKQENDPNLKEIKTVLKKIHSTATLQKNHYDDYVDFNDYHQLAKKYGTHYLPFNQVNDPFKGPDFAGYCWGHTHRYGKLVAKGCLDYLSQASSKKLYETFTRNWTITDILFRRIGWYFSVQLEQKMRSAIWNALKDMDETTIFNFNFLIKNHGFHSTGLRMVGDGIEYYENNYGLVRFNTREDAVNFLAAHLLKEASKVIGGEVSFITVYKLPYKNDPDEDIWKGLSQGKIEKEKPSIPEAEVKHDKELEEAINALRVYSQQLSQSNIKGKIKAKEICYLTDELDSLSVDKVMERVGAILANKDHSLMLNRGTGLYFLQSGFQSRSTTETLLRTIYKIAEHPSSAKQIQP
jgi:hypothetical protein